MKYVLEYRHVIPAHWKNDSPDVYYNVDSGFSVEPESSSFIEWVDNETFNKVHTGNQAPHECYRLRNPEITSNNLAPCAYYTITEKTPISGQTPENKNVGWIVKYKLNYKMTFVGQWIINQQVILNARTKRCSYSQWSPDGRIPDDRIMDALKDTYTPVTYIYGDTPRTWVLTNFDRSIVKMPVIMYHVLSENGKIYLIPEFHEFNDPDKSRNGVEVLWKGRRILNNQYYCNNAQNIESRMSKNNAGYMGKFFGPNLNMLMEEYNPSSFNDFATISSDDTITNYKILAIRYQYDMFSTEFYTVTLPKVKNVDNSYHKAPIYDVNDGTNNTVQKNVWTYEHLEYMTLKVFDNVYDLPILNWTKPNQYGTTVQFVMRMPGVMVRADGIFSIMDQYRNVVNNKPSVERYITYEDIDNSTFHFSEQLPTVIDTYKQWANDNLTALSSQYRLKQQSTVLNGVLSGIAALVGIVGSVVTGGATLPLVAAGVGGVAGVIKSTSSVVQNHEKLLSTIEQAKMKYKGNIVSGAGTSFAYYNYYLGNISQSNDYASNKTPLTFHYLSNEQKKIIDHIYYYYGRAKLDVFEVLDLTSIENGWDFLYFELNYEDDILITFFSAVITAIGQTNIVATSPDIIYSYLLNFVKSGVRIHKPV